MTPEQLEGVIERLRRQHPIQYGFKGKLMILHTENITDSTVTDRMNRCPVCEQWSPCDVRKLISYALEA